MILFTFENDKNTAIETEAFTSAREQFTCSDFIPTYPIGPTLTKRVLFFNKSQLSNGATARTSIATEKIMSFMAIDGVMSLLLQKVRCSESE